MEIHGVMGESLGKIGHAHDHAGDVAQEQEEWKQQFLAKPSVSERRGIAWGFNPPYEDTSTLVLTTPGSHFVDVRFCLSGQWTSGASFWAFAGDTSITFPSSAGSGSSTSTALMPYVAHGKWFHGIDSRGDAFRDHGTSSGDEGDLFLLRNGECIEVGQMRNPATGKLEMYKEYWKSLLPLEEEAASNQGPNGSNREENSLKPPPTNTSRYVCGEMRSPDQVLRGMVICVADRCQGILQLHGDTERMRVERWQKDRLGHWQKDPKSNTSFGALGISNLPCAKICQRLNKVGDKIHILGATWTIIESSD